MNSDTTDTLATLKRTDIVGIIEASGLGVARRMRRGQVLFWQNDPVDHLYLVRSGTVKTNTLNTEGRRRTYGFWGRGSLLGLTSYTLAEDHVATARVLQTADILLVSLSDLDCLIKSDATFSLHLIRQLAHAVKVFLHEVDALSFLDVQGRLKRNLEELALQHGHSTPSGIEIDLAVTHEDIAELTGANRTTITAHLNDLKKQGYLWTSGRHLVIVSRDHIRILENLAEAVLMLDAKDALRWARRAIDEEVDLVKLLDVLARTLHNLEPGDGTRKDQEAPLAAAAVTSTLLEILLEAYESRPSGWAPVGRVVIGTLPGDPHDVGKLMTSVLLARAGYEIVDLGVEVGWEQYAAAVREHQPSILAISSAIEVDRQQEEGARKFLESGGLLDQVTLLLGGRGFSAEIADRLGAAGYAGSVLDTVQLVGSLSDLD